MNNFPHHSESECQDTMRAVQDALFVISGKWKMLIIISLSHGHKRFTEIERSIPKLSSKVLAKELKDLEENKLIKRTVYDEYPVRIAYTLTDYAQSLENVMLALATWGNNHRKKILEAVD